MMEIEPRKSRNMPAETRERLNRGAIPLQEFLELDLGEPYHPLCEIDGNDLVLRPYRDRQAEYRISHDHETLRDLGDWIRQIHQKQWLTPEMLYDFVTAWFTRGKRR